MFIIGCKLFVDRILFNRLVVCDMHNSVYTNSFCSGAVWHDTLIADLGKEIEKMF